MAASRRVVIVGSGPNGLSAGALLARRGWQVDVYEAAERAGGAARSHASLGEGTIVDVGAAAHPFGAASPVFRSLQLEQNGLAWARSRYAMAHPLDGGDAAFLRKGVELTAQGLGADAQRWERVFAPLTRDIDQHLDNILGPLLRIPPHPLHMLSFGIPALSSARHFSQRVFREEKARALFVGSAVHAIAMPSQLLTSSFGLVFGSLGQSTGWPVAVGGTQAIVDSLLRVLISHGGKVHVNHPVDDLGEFSGADAIILNLTPAQVLALKGIDLQWIVRHRMRRWQYGAASYKVDLLLDRPIPWAHPEVAQATTVHVCGGADEIQRAEREVAHGQLPEHPFVLVCQQQVADPSRSTGATHVAWAYTHVPKGTHGPRAPQRILDQIERFAPGMTSTILRINEQSPAALEKADPNLVHGDVAGGRSTGEQALLRMPYRLGPRLFMASASTAPGGGVHGMPGYWAARAVLRSTLGSHEYR